MKLLFTAIIIATFTLPAGGEEIYGTGRCWSAMNPDARISVDMYAKINATNTKAYLSSIGETTTIAEAAIHRTEQCRLKKVGKPYATQCPVGHEISIDAHVQAAIDAHATKSEAALKQTLDEAVADLHKTLEKMAEVCR